MPNKNVAFYFSFKKEKLKWLHLIIFYIIIYQFTYIFTDFFYH